MSPALRRPRGSPAPASSHRSFPASRERDDESGLMHFRARSYDPRLGRFIQRDPLIEREVADAYRYANNDPATQSDPRGLAPRLLITGTNPPQDREKIKALVEKGDTKTAAEVIRGYWDSDEVDVREGTSEIIRDIAAGSITATRQVLKITQALSSDSDLEIRARARHRHGLDALRLTAWLSAQVRHRARNVEAEAFDAVEMDPDLGSYFDELMDMRERLPNLPLAAVITEIKGVALAGRPATTFLEDIMSSLDRAKESFERREPASSGFGYWSGSAYTGYHFLYEGAIKVHWPGEQKIVLDNWEPRLKE